MLQIVAYEKESDVKVKAMNFENEQENKAREIGEQWKKENYCVVMRNILVVGNIGNRIKSVEEL